MLNKDTLSDGFMYSNVSPEQQDEYLESLIESLEDLDTFGSVDIPNDVSCFESFLNWIKET